jgi:hypothetical protein
VPPIVTPSPISMCLLITPRRRSCSSADAHAACDAYAAGDRSARAERTLRPI